MRVLASIAAALLGMVAPAMAAEPINIGVLMSSTGILAPLVVEQVNGMQMAIDEFGGAIAGRPINMIVEDDETKPNIGLQKARKLIFSDHVDVIAGVLASPVALAISPFAEANKIPIVLSNAGANALTDASCQSLGISRFVFGRAGDRAAWALDRQAGHQAGLHSDLRFHRLARILRGISQGLRRRRREDRRRGLYAVRHDQRFRSLSGAGESDQSRRDLRPVFWRRSHPVHQAVRVVRAAGEA